MLLLTVTNKSKCFKRLAKPEKLLNKSNVSSVIILYFSFFVKLFKSSLTSPYCKLKIIESFILNIFSKSSSDKDFSEEYLFFKLFHEIPIFKS